MGEGAPGFKRAFIVIWRFISGRLQAML